MAVYNEVQVGRYVRFLQKFFGIKGRQPAPLTFSGEIGTVIGLMHGVENRYMESWFRFGMSASQAAVAGNLAEVVLRNPKTSGIISVLESVFVFNSSAAGANFHFDTGPALAGVDKGTVLTPQGLDSRQGPNVGSPMILTSGTTLGGQIVGTTTRIFPLNTSASIELILFEDQEITLLPGSGCQVEIETVNAGLVVSYIWRQRPLEEGEQS